jgi:nitric oxide synthase oxygenase domain/subunit
MLLQELYHHEKGSAPAVKDARTQEVLAAIEATGTYTHTWDELQHGAQQWSCFCNTPICMWHSNAITLCSVGRALIVLLRGP